MEYQAAVAEAQRLVKRSEADQWRLAELTFEQLQAGVTQDRWAEDVGLSRRTVRRYAAVWERFGAASANRTTFADAAFEIDGGGVNMKRIESLPPEQKAQVVKEALADPDVAKRALRDPSTRARLTDAREQVASEIEDTASIRERSTPEGQGFAAAHEISRLRVMFADATAKVRDAIELRAQIGRVYPDRVQPGMFDRDVADLEGMVDQFKMLDGSGTVTDDEIAQLLEGGS